MFIILNLLSLVAIGIISWYLTGLWTACVVIIFVAFYLLTILNFYTHFISNDYQYLEDITAGNQRVKVHNAHIELVKKEMEDVKAAIQSGANNKGIIGANLMGKAADMIKKNIETTKVVVPAVIKEVVTKENTWGGNSGGATVPK